ncbi:MAG: hydantoinase/oxoprolinase family protein [Conexibacter sp.]|nr:hydantoinase/oxoprolinase family protein [Conexibacter sp.]
MAYRITVDTGGTFTDVVVADGEGRLFVGKSPTRERAFEGVSGGLEIVAEELGLTLAELLADTSVFIYSTTRATNAILEGRIAKTALLVTEGFPDVLVLREGGKLHGFDLRVPFPEPYIPRRRTWEIPERIDSEGEVVKALDEAQTRKVLESLTDRGIEAVAVCLLWSNVNGTHETRVGELIEEILPGVPYTLSHEINPIVREYRRASSAAIDASLKPLMGAHLRQVALDLREAGFAGELMAATSFGGAMHVEDLSSRPIYSVRSGPAMAPVAGKTYAKAELGVDDVIVCDTGGTSFDVSLVRDGAVSFTRDTWLGPQFTGHLTGSSSVDVRSIGAGGGSIAWVDPGGLLRVGPQSAGAEPGPACYGRGGERPTVTDAAVVLGYIDPDTFLGGRMQLDAGAARTVLAALGEQLGLDVEQAAEAVLAVANEHMVRAIQEITINEGVDPRESLVVAGGGAAGLGIAPIVRELGCERVLVPRTAGALSATGAQFSDIVAEFTASAFADTGQFDHDGVNAALVNLEAQVEEFSRGLRAKGVEGMRTELFVDARYAYQVWELEVPLPTDRIGTAEEVEGLARAFDTAHERVFSVNEPGARIECLTWKARLFAPIGQTVVDGVPSVSGDAERKATPRATRDVFFGGAWQDTPIYVGGALPQGAVIEGPAIIEEPTSTLVVPLAAKATVSDLDNYLLEVAR